MLKTFDHTLLKINRMCQALVLESEEHRPGFKYQLYYLPALSPRAGFLIFLNLILFICKVAL